METSTPESGMPVTPPVAQSMPSPAVHGPRKNRGIIAGVVVVALLIGGYLAYAYGTDAWPFTHAEPMAEWKTYTNERYGFEIKYPGTSAFETPQESALYGFYVRIENYDSSAEGRGGLLPGEYYLEIQALQDPGECSADQYTETFTLESGQTMLKDEGVEGVEGGDAGGGGSISLCTTSPVGIRVTGTELDERADLVRRILSTFRFTTPVLNPMAGWKTYANTQYGFAFKYPAQFSVPAASHEVKNAFFTEAPGPSILSYAGFEAHDSTNDKVEVGVYQVVTTDETKVSVGNDFILLGTDATKASVGGKASYEMEPFTALGSLCYLTRAYIPTGSTTIVVGMETCSTEPATDNSIPETPSAEAVARMRLQFDQVLSTFTFTAPNPTAGWKTYTNTEFGFEFQYPADRTLHGPTVSYEGATPTGISLGLDVEHPTYDKERFEVEIFGTSPAVQSIEELACEIHSESPPACITEYRTILGNRFVVNTYLFTEGKGAGAKGKNAAVIRGENVYLFDTGFTGRLYDAYSVTELAAREILFDQILATFRFTTPDTMAGWKTYANSEVGFEFKYPPTWVVQDLGITQRGIVANPPDFQMPTSGTVHHSFSIGITAHGYSGDEQPVTRTFGTRTGYVYPLARSVYFPDSQSAGGYIIQLDGPAGSSEPDQILSTFTFY